ncbi:YD repeat-containing protein [Bacillus toyonensis]|nr:hypothetical protein [Bacillus toyonensis]OSM10363.1 hypothetical protein BTH38_25210 [Bacillus toyonensis]SLK18597.1 YD repeat-containing protein [Bacillus toyonensis]
MSLAFNAGNQLETYGNEKLKCDANGNRTADGKYSYTWNEADQLTTITKQGETTPFAKSVDPDPGDEDDPVTQNGYTYADNNPLMKVDPDGHKAWKKKGKRIWYATKAGAKAVYQSYTSIGKALSLSVGFSIGYSKGKFQYKKQNRPAYNKAYVNKAARKAGLKVGAKVFWGVGLIEDAYTFGSAAYKGYKKAYKSYR